VHKITPLTCAVGEQDLSSRDPSAGMVDQPRDGQRRHRLARTRLAHDRQRLAFANVQVQFAHHGRNAVIGGKANAQPLDIKQFPRLRQRRIPLRVMTH
jgi:hypothetical protein